MTNVFSRKPCGPVTGETPISFEESSRQIDDLVAAANEAGRTGTVDEAVACWRAVLDHPCAYHQVVGHEILDEIHQLLRGAGRYEEAIDAKRETIAAGYRSTPDPEADIAECLLAAGRREEADRLYAQLRERDPADVWLNNSAAYTYGGVDDREALRWSLDGIDLAIATGDHDQVIGQLLDCAERSWQALGEPADAGVVTRVEEFQRAWTRPPWRTTSWAGSEARRLRACTYCDWRPEDLGRPGTLTAIEPVSALMAEPEVRGPAQAGARGKVPLSVAWFAAGEWPEAVRRWPDLLDELPEEHRSYCRETEARIKRLAKHLTGTPVHLSPVTVDGLVDYAYEHGEDPGAAGTRSMYAAELLRVGQVRAWPPGRNEPCWCGSGEKYKRCCGPVVPAPDD